MSVTTTPRCTTQEGGPPHQVDREALHESFRDARSHGASIGEAIALVASAYNIGSEIVQMSVLGALESARDEERDPTGPAGDPLAWSEVRPQLTGIQASPPPLFAGLAQEASLVQARGCSAREPFA